MDVYGNEGDGKEGNREKVGCVLIILTGVLAKRVFGAINY